MLEELNLRVSYYCSMQNRTRSFNSLMKSNTPCTYIPACRLRRPAFVTTLLFHCLCGLTIAERGNNLTLNHLIVTPPFHPRTLFHLQFNSIKCFTCIFKAELNLKLLCWYSIHRVSSHIYVKYLFCWVWTISQERGEEFEVYFISNIILLKRNE